MMDPALQAETLALLIDRLIDEGDARVQERILVDEICRGEWAQAAGLWRRAEGARGWIEVLARGPEDLLPNGDQVAAIHEGKLPGELPLGKRVLFAKDNSGLVALAIGGCEEGTAEDVLGSLLEVFCRFSVESSGANAWGDVDLLDLLQPPAPGHGDGETERE